MSIAISDAIQQAQQAIEGGDYRSAIQTCNKLVGQFPDYAAAYRVLGEAYLEQGQTADAEQAFAEALLRDPRQPWAYHGLGVIAEEQNILDNALAFCQVAWELAPNYAQLRDPVIRIASRRYGADGQAQLTSAALAQIYANTFRLQRAATEYRGALEELPDRVDLKLGLAETLWLLGKEDDAAGLCRDVLQENPVAIQALVILADIEGRAGNTTEAGDLRARIRAVDPDGSITALMLSRNERADRDSLLVAADSMPVLDETAEAVVAERPHIAPAPDFGYQPARAEQPVQEIEDLEPISAEEFGSEAVEFEAAVDDSAEMAMEDIDTGQTSVSMPAETQHDDAPSIYRADADDVTVDLEQEFSLVEPEPSIVEPEAAQEAVVETTDDFDALAAEFGDVEPMAIEEFGAEPEDIERLAAEGDLLADNDMFADLTSPFPSEGTAADHLSNLTSAIEDDVAGVLDRTGEHVPQETAPEPPAEDTGTGYTTVLRELGDEGLTPFDPMGRPEMPDAATQAQQAGDMSAEQTQAAADDDIARLTEDWDSIDDEIARAVPMTTGHTDQLRAADDLGIAPFDFEIEDDTARLPAYRPFGEDDSEINLDAELEAETVAETEPVAEGEQVPSTEATEEDLLADLEPFSFEEFDENAADEQSFAFGSLPWETSPSGSAVPSDEDFEALLASEDTPAPAVEEPAQPAETTEPADEVDWTIAIQDTETAAPAAEQEQGPKPSVFETPASWNQPTDWDSSLAVTRQIGEQPDDINERLAAAEAAAQESQQAQDVVEEPAESVAKPTTGLFRRVDPDKLADDEGIFTRSRLAKTGLIAEGRISGDRALVEEEPVVELEPVPEPVMEEPVVEAPAEEDFIISTGATRDVNTLRASLQSAPNDDELRWWLSEALRERGDIEEAYGQYRWLIRNAPHRADDVIASLNACVEQEQFGEMGHRLLADLYRRRGAVSLASSHAATAMAIRRQMRG